jgi:hypothetical protein
MTVSGSIARHGVAALLALALGTTAGAATLTVTDSAGEPLATVMVRERRVGGPALDTSDDGYPAPGVTQVVAPGRCRSRAATSRWNTCCASPATRTS